MKTLRLLRQAALTSIIGLLATITIISSTAQAQPILLGQAMSFGVLSGTTVTNTGPSVIFGNLGISPGTAMTGFNQSMFVGGGQQLNNAFAIQAQADLVTAYDALADEASTQDLTGQDLGGLTLLPGVYNFDSSAQLTGALVLDAQGDSGARFYFQMGSTLTTASASTVTVINGGNTENVFWQVGSSATLGTGTAFTGNILAMTSITLETDASIIGGRALARNGAVTMAANRVGVVVPESSTAVLLSCIALPLAGLLGRRKRVG